jgi:hypothetical protein
MEDFALSDNEEESVSAMKTLLKDARKENPQSPEDRQLTARAFEKAKEDYVKRKIDPAILAANLEEEDSDEEGDSKPELSLAEILATDPPGTFSSLDTAPSSRPSILSRTSSKAWKSFRELRYRMRKRGSPQHPVPVGADPDDLEFNTSHLETLQPGGNERSGDA